MTDIPPKYLMENESESHRLNIKTDRTEIRDQLIATGFSVLKPGAKIVDAGCGAGYVSEVMSNELISVKKVAKISLLDMSAKRLESARLLLKGRRGIEFDFFECSLSEIPLPDNSQDYIFCRFVFEYLQYPAKVFDELLRILAHGGKLVVGDLDYNCMTHYGLSEELESQLFELSGKLFRAKMLDPWVGRKLYSFFYSRKMREIKVHFSAHHLFYGDLPGRDLENWTAKLDQLSELQMKGGISLSFNMADFKAEFLRFLVDKSRFSYTPMLLVEGKKSA